MTGTGTQTDPFCPTNWSEFVTAIGQSGVHIECPENAVWDMNEMLPEGIRSSISWYDNTVHGNGLTINNLYLNGGYFSFYRPYSSLIHNIEKLNFFNLATSGSNEKMFSIGSSGYNVQFKNCKFSGLVSSGCIFSSSGNSYMYLTHDGEKSCSLDFKLMGNGTLHNNSPYYRYCNIKLDGETASQSQSGYTTYEKCYISGKSPWKYLYMYGYDNILDLEIPEGKYIQGASYSDSHMNTSVINIDKMHGEYSDNRYKYIEATTEQLSNAAYLQSKGFSIAG